MAFAQIIKALRRDNNMTQEKLAELLSISQQAISRWESDLAMPDISLIPALANLFGVTTDYLLGMDTKQKDLRKAEFDEAFKEYWKNDDKEQNYQIAACAAAEYPGNMEYVEWLASAEYYIAVTKHDKAERRDLLESSVKHYNTVLDNCNDSKLFDQALHGIVLALHMLGRNSEAKEYAMRQVNQDNRNELLCRCLNGEEKEKLVQKIAEGLLDEYLFRSKFTDKSMQTRDAEEKILKALFPNGKA